MKHVIFFCDWQMLPGLHVSLLSMLESLDGSNPDPIHIVVFADQIPEVDKAPLYKTHAIRPLNTTFEVRDFSAQKLEGGSDLHGNTTGYGNFYLAEDLLPEVDQCLSLDADILVHTDVHKMFEYFDGENVLLVDGTAKRDWDRHSELYKTAGLDMTKPCFNAGIAGFDLKLWRELNITNKCKEVAIQYSHMLKGADQAILNVALHDKFLAWGKKYNHSLRLKNPQIKEMEDVIYHFVGAPKPWDLFGKQLHNNFPIWYDVYKRTAIGKTPLRKYISLNRARKTWRSTARVWLEKIKSK